MDEKVTLAEQMNDNVGSVIFINKFNIKPDEVEQFLKDWAEDALYFKKQPGFISLQLHRGISGTVCLSIMLSGNLLSI